MLSRLSHPGVATIFDFDVQDGRDFLVMALVTGGMLDPIRTDPRYWPVVQLAGLNDSAMADA